LAALPVGESAEEKGKVPEDGVAEESDLVMEAKGLGRGGSVDRCAGVDAGEEVDAMRVPFKTGAPMAEPESAIASAAKEVFIVKSAEG
jgi:hypothetical protein